MQTIRKHRSILRIRFANGMQYRAAALAGIVTQFAWGGMYLILYHTFYQSGTGAFPMDMQALSAYIWLQQAFLALFMIWGMDNDIFELISSGNIAYELCRPCDLYSMIFFRTLGSRLARAVLRCFPILLVAALLPSPYGIRLPPSWGAAGLFLVSFLLGALVVGAFCMLIYISAFFTISPMGVRLVAVAVVDFFSGAIIPLPFFPEKLQVIFSLLPFGSMQNVPYRIYGGDLAGLPALVSILIQAFWLLALLLLGRLMMRKALQRVVIQGG